MDAGDDIETKSPDARRGKPASSSDPSADTRETSGPPPEPELPELPELPEEALDDETKVLWRGKSALGALPAADKRVPTEFAGYQISEEIGRGGMGVVYKARDPELGRTVALKVLLSAEHASGEEVQRFFREASSAAKLQHPNIVPIHELKSHEDKHYYTMDFIEGHSLDRLIKDRRLEHRKGIEIVEKVARALAFAHGEGVVHRDLKPANIILDLKDEPRVMDFGLAKIVSSDEEEITAAGITRTGTAIGTPYYESPEQAAGYSRNVDARSDVYSLGCILYQMLTGSPPFTAATAMEVLRMQIEEDPVPPNRAGAGVSPDIETICLKCLEKDPDRRYQTADELADDLRRYLDGAPVAARRASMLYVARRKIARHGAVTTVIAAAVIFICAMAVMHHYRLRLALREAQAAREDLKRARIWAEKLQAKAERERHAAVEARKRAMRSLYASRISMAYDCALGRNTLRADELLFGCPQAMRNWEWGFVSKRAHQEENSWVAHCRPVTSVALTPDGRVLVSGSLDGVVKVWALPGGKCSKTIRAHVGGVRNLALNAAGTLLASCGNDRRVRIWTTKDWRLLATYKANNSAVSSVCFSPDGMRLAAACIDGLVAVWSLETGKIALRIKVPAHSSHGLAFSPDGRLLAATAPEEVTIWDARKGRLRRRLTGHKWGGRALAFSPNGKLLVTQATTEGPWTMWDVHTGKMLRTAEGHREDIVAVKFTDDGKRLITASYDRTIRTWNPSTGKELRCLIGSVGEATTIALHPNGSLLFSGGADGVIRTWDLAAESTLGTHNRTIRSVAFSPNAKLLASAGGGLKMWEVSTRRLRHAITPELGYRAAAFSPDSARVAAAGYGDQIDIWDAASGKEIAALKGHEGTVISLAFCPKGKYLASAGLDKTVRIWSTDKWAHARTLSEHAKGVCAVAFSADGRYLASAGEDHDVILWNTGTWNPVRTLKGHTSNVSSLAFGPDGKTLASCAGPPANVIRLWSVATGDEIRTLSGHLQRVFAVAFTPDGKRLISASRDHTIRVWDQDTGRQLLKFEAHSQRVEALALDPSGRLLASGGRDRLLKMWSSADWRRGNGARESDFVTMLRLATVRSDTYKRRSILTSWTAAHPHSARAWEEYAAFLLDQRDKKGALSAARRASRLTAGMNPVVQGTLAQALMANGDLDAAGKVAITSDAFKAMIESAKGERQKILLCKAWVATVPESAEGLNEYSWSLLTCEEKELRDHKTALTAARRAVELSDYRDPMIIDTLALALFKNGQIKEAVKTQKQAIEKLKPKVRKAERNSYLKRLKEYEDALRSRK